VGEACSRLEGLSHELEDATSRLDAVSSRLREQVMKLRMVPISGLFNKYRRVVRDMSHSLGKEIQVQIRGSETELDKLLVERLDDPLLHLVRNAVDHGVELPTERQATGKPHQGTLVLSASHRGHQMVIEIADDGAGLDPERVGAKALERGLVSSEDLSRMDRHQLLELIFLPGLSTASEVTGLSGRGVGMDVVRETISSLKGSIEIHSEPGAGARFVLQLPLTLAISNVLFCRAGGQDLAVPIHAVKHTLIADAETTRQVASMPTLKLDREVPLIDVAGALGLPHPAPHPPFPVALVEAMGGTYGLVFEQLLDRQEIVIKSLGSLLERVPCCAGATLVGERCALILDVPALVRRSLDTTTRPPADRERQPGLPTVLVVEDSDTVREDLRRLLVEAGFEVLEARDGEDALRLADQRVVDLVSTDVIMPGIDGYELCRRLRRLPGYDEVPIIMLTSRDQEIDRISGFDAGVDAYMVKPVSRSEMLELVRRLLGAPHDTGGGR
jgi:chemotaxis protein histidine kinase CheA